MNKVSTIETPINKVAKPYSSPIILADGRRFEFEELVGEMREDGTGERMQYARFKCSGTMCSIAHEPITPVYLDKEDNASQGSPHSHHWCS